MEFSELSSVLDRSPNEGKSEKSVHLVFFAFAGERAAACPYEAYLRAIEDETPSQLLGSGGCARSLAEDHPARHRFYALPAEPTHRVRPGAGFSSTARSANSPRFISPRLSWSLCWSPEKLWNSMRIRPSRSRWRPLFKNSRLSPVRAGGGSNFQDWLAHLNAHRFRGSRQLHDAGDTANVSVQRKGKNQNNNFLRRKWRI